MAITIDSNILSASGINRALSGLETSSERIASGSQINRAGDDAAGLALSNRASTEIIGFNQAIRNASDGISLVQVADGSLGSIGDNLQRFRELAVQASNGILNDSDRAAINAEALQLRDEINRIVSQSSFNNVPLFNNQAAIDLQVGGDSGETVSIETQNIQQQLADLSFGNIDLSSASGAQEALSVLDEAQNLVTQNASDLGAISNRLDNTVARLQTSSITAEQSRSRIADADIAREVSDQTRNEILLQAGLAVQMQANMRSELVLRLLSG